MSQCQVNKTKKEYQTLVNQFANGHLSVRCRNRQGYAKMEAYPLFGGAKIMFAIVHTDWCVGGNTPAGDCVEIHYCQEGSMLLTSGRSHTCLTSGDAALIRASRSAADRFSFPTNHYHGICITFSQEQLSGAISGVCEALQMMPEIMLDILSGSDHMMVIKKQEVLKQLFSGFDMRCADSRQDYMKVKFLELLLLMSGLDSHMQTTNGKSMSEFQVRLAHEVADYLMKNEDQHITVSELACRFHVSQAHLRNSFRGVYGVPVYSYVRVRKMQKAAELLQKSTLTIRQIASECGYDNASKFSAAFKAVVGEAPLEYRNNHK